MDPAVNTLLQQGIAAARAGRRAEARALLTRVVEADERSEQGWLWLAGVSDDPADVRTCLNNVLELNPTSAAAKKGLAWAEQRFGASAAPSLERSVGEPPVSPPPAKTLPASSVVPAANPVTTTTVSMAREQFEQRAAQRPEASSPAAPARQPTTRLREEAVFDPLSSIQSFGAPAATSRLPERSTRPAAPTMLMETVTPAVAAAPPVPAAPPPVLSAPPSPVAAPMRPAAAPAEAVPSAPPENPCPFCGAPTTVKQQRCTQCRQSLMTRAPRAERRSPALTALGVVWIIGGLIALIGAGLVGALMVLQRQAPVAGSVPGGFLAIVLAAVLLFGLLCFGVARGLWARVREFYFLNIALVVVGVVVRVGLLFRGAALFAGLAVPAGLAGQWADVIATTAVVLPLALLVLLVVLPAILTILSYRDFFPPLVRFVPALEKGDHVAHYNRGLGYRDRGMWYMVVQEWFTSARMRPGERAYLPALGLAYAQIKQLYPNSKAYVADIEAFLRGRKAELYAATPELERMRLLD